METNTLLRLLPLVLLPIAFFLAFGHGVPDGTYDALLADAWLGSIPIDVLRAAAVASLIASALLAYYLFSDSPPLAFAIALFVVLAPGAIGNASLLLSPRDSIALPLFFLAVAIGYRLSGGMRAIAILPAALAGYLLLPDFQWFIHFRNVGMLFPLAFLSGVSYFQQKQWQPLLWLLAALAGAAVAFPLALVAATVSAGMALRIALPSPTRTGWSVLIAATAFYLLLFTGSSYALFAGMAIGAGTLFYLLLSLYQVQPHWWAMAFAFLLLLNIGLGNLLVESHRNTIAPQALRESWASLGSGSVGILRFTHTFAYYTQQHAESISLSDLLREPPLDVQYLSFSRDTLLESLAPTGRAFAFVQAQSDGRLLFGNARYLLLIAPSPNQREVLDAVLFDRATGGQAAIAFTKLRALHPGLPLSDSDNVLINTDGIEDSVLYALLTRSEIVYQKDGAYILAIGDGNGE